MKILFVCTGIIQTDCRKAPKWLGILDAEP